MGCVKEFRIIGLFCYYFSMKVYCVDRAYVGFCTIREGFPLRFMYYKEEEETIGN